MLSTTSIELVAYFKELQCVRDELDPAVPMNDKIPSYLAIETLPCFNALIPESLSLQLGAMSGLYHIIASMQRT